MTDPRPRLVVRARSPRATAPSVLGAVLAGLLAFPAEARADDWPSPHPRAWHGRGFEHLVEVFPGKARNNPGDRPFAFFYRMGYPGAGWKSEAQLVWKGALANAVAPYEALVSMSGWLVTLDDWGSLGFANALVVYDPAGRLVKAWSFDDLIPAADRDRAPRSRSSRRWREGARYYFLAKPERLYVVLAWGKALEIDLAGGKAAYGPSAGFAGFQPDSNAEAEVWEVSLRFSSVTDVVALREACAAAAPARRPGARPKARPGR